jgi:predicted HicB family RNase H-like nuclease
MSKKHRKTLAAIRRKPTSGTIRWADIESLLIWLGAERGIAGELYFARGARDVSPTPLAAGSDERRGGIGGDISHRNRGEMMNAKRSKSKAPRHATAKVACKCEVGPYKGYLGVAAYDADDGGFHGRLLGIRDVVTFEGDTPAEVAEAFEGSVDEYLAYCARRGEEPNKPFSGKFLVRLPQDLHWQLSAIAESRATSMNALVVEGLEKHARGLMAHTKAPRR